MTTISEIFRAFGPEYIKRFGDHMPGEHLKVIDAIVKCRTQEAGSTRYECERCGCPHVVHRSCGNRHCPTCQHRKTRQWLETQINRLLPGHHFLITFTVPENLRFFMRSHQRVAYAALFKSSAEAIKKLAGDERHIGGDLPGFFGVLHTWGRTLQYHPHVHYVVAGGALNAGAWQPSRRDFYLPVRALSKVFRAKFRDEMHAAGLLDQIPADVWEQEWIVNCQAVGDSSTSLSYLAPYVFKVAISNSRIVKVQNRTVTFRYRKSSSQRMRTMTLDVMEFIRRFLQHVLPTGFMKVRYFGFMNPNCKVQLDTLRDLIQRTTGLEPAQPQVELQPWRIITPTCPRCKGTLLCRGMVFPNRQSQIRLDYG